MEKSFQQPISLSWTFGFNKTKRIFYAGNNPSQKFLLFASAQSGVLYDHQNKRQKILQGHSNQISSISMTFDRRWFCTVDAGPDSMILIWENMACRPENASMTDNELLLGAFPIKNIYDAHGGYGCVACEFTNDSKYLITLGADPEQTLCVWDWSGSNAPLVKKLPKRQTQIKVNPWDTTEMMTLGEDSIYFYTVDADWKSMEMHVPEMAIDEFNVEQAMFTCANYLSVPGQACVGTSSGELILLANRSLSNLGASLPIGEKSAIKIIKVHNGPVTALTVTKKLIMTGGQDGMLKLFDLQCRLLFWYDQFNSGGITNILSNPFGELLYQEGIPEIIVSTEQSQIFLLSRQEGSAIPFRPSTASTGFDYHTGTPSISSRADDEKKANGPLCQTILEGIYGVISKMDVNPVQPRLAIGTTKGQLQLWDLNQKTLITSRRFYEKIKQGKKETLKPLAITSLEFSKTGKSMGIGFENGLVKFLEASSLLDIHSNNILSKIMEYQSSNVSIDHISFSQDGLWCACADSNNVTILFKKETLKMKPESAGTEATEIKKPRSRIEWVFVGRRKTHYKSIVSLLFHQSSIQGSPQRLLVVSKDRHVSEIDLEQCNTADGIKLKFVRRLEQIYQPETAIILPAQKEDYLLTFTTGSKFRLFQSETQVCKNTCLGPSFGASIHRITLLNDKKTVCFGTDNMLGLGKLPLDGNPYRYTGILAHPTKISQLTQGPLGALTSAGEDEIVHYWVANPYMLDQQFSSQEDPFDAFLAILDPDNPTRSSPIYQEFNDFFLYSQIKEQGEDTFVERGVGDTIGVEAIGEIVQAMGYYASKQDLEDMITQVKFGLVLQSTYDTEVRTETKRITLDELITLFVNHRPVAFTSLEELQIALSHAKRLEPGRPLPVGPVPKVEQTETIKTDGLQSLLSQYGESMTSEEFTSSLSQLVYTKVGLYGKVPSRFTVNDFVQNILGLETYDPSSPAAEPSN